MTDKPSGFDVARFGTEARCEITTSLGNYSWPGHLTDRQAHILRDRLNGHSWRTIANAYNIHEATARGHHRAALAAIERAKRSTA